MTTSRRYQDVAHELRQLIRARGMKQGERLMAERQVSEELGVSRSLVREALIMLEIEGLVEVRQGSGVYLRSSPDDKAPPLRDDIGPFELLQARQLLESNIAAFAAEMVTKNDIVRMKEALDVERRGIETGNPDYSGDEMFHRLIAEATQNSVLVDMVQELWNKREQSSMWARLHERIFDGDYRKAWLDDHRAILLALQNKDPQAARRAMWQHLENVRETLMDVSDVEDPEFDGYLFQPIGQLG
ncbi:FCD domain-containing protein [Roseibium aestuarii]|uniref:FCD domain-containing protein n=1 Tax=Roseibium aestuarii TaxID=2600299 RepID=A0ABW4JXJ0_9HYPH|nr:FCD domain-containing protein [Roseibium aestuarii]